MLPFLLLLLFFFEIFEGQLYDPILALCAIPAALYTLIVGYNASAEFGDAKLRLNTKGLPLRFSVRNNREHTVWLFHRTIIELCLYLQVLVPPQFFLIPLIGPDWKYSMYVLSFGTFLLCVYNNKRGRYIEVPGILPTNAGQMF